jgi:protein ImuA
MVVDAKLAGLRRRIEGLEAAGPGRLGEGARAALGLGHADVDQHFGVGGLLWGSHQLGGTVGDALSARTFGLMLLSRFLAAQPRARALVVQEASALRETGGLYGPGLHALGLDPGRLVIVQTADGAGALRAINDALRAKTSDILLAELGDGAGLADLSVTRRFNLAAQQARVLVLLTTPDLSATSAALTRWRVAAAPSDGRKRRLGAPTLMLDLVRNRHGRTGRWILQWNSHDRAFSSVPLDRAGIVLRPGPAVAAPVVSAAGDRPGDARAGAAGLAPGPYRQAG